MTSLVGPRKAKTEDILNTEKDAQRGNLSRAHVMLQMWVCDEQAFPPVYVQPCCSAREKPGPESRKKCSGTGKQGSIAGMSVQAGVIGGGEVRCEQSCE